MDHKYSFAEGFFATTLPKYPSFGYGRLNIYSVHAVLFNINSVNKFGYLQNNLSIMLHKADACRCVYSFV